MDSNTEITTSPSTPPPRRLIGVSLKMYFRPSETLSYLTTIRDLLLAQHPSGLPPIDIFLLPDFLTLHPATTLLYPALPRASLWLGAQDCAAADAGPFTGDTSPRALADLGVRIVAVGHAERRRLHGETDASTAAKAAAAARCGLVPLVCVGEGERGEVAAAAEAVLRQVEGVLAAVPEGAEVVLAYEPVWAIGAAEAAGAEHVVGVVGRVRAAGCVARRRGETRVVYGGSAGQGVFGRLKGVVDGLFLGRFAHDPEVFAQTVREVAEA